jgi:UDP-2-acetamido-3-amino-2,3-dideoxy-glucuronate N-acetyltransferase
MSFQVHASAIIDENVTIGSGTKIWHFSHISSGANIGNNCSLGQNVYVGAKVKIGNNVKIQNNVSVYEGVEIEDNVFCGPSMVFTNVYNPRSSINRKNEFRKTLVKNGATIGANATIVCGITIGEHAFIGAGSVIKRNVKPFEIMVGVPGRHIGWMCSCGVRLPFTSEFKVVACNVCGLMFMLEQNECSLVHN